MRLLLLFLLCFHFLCCSGDESLAQTQPVVVTRETQLDAAISRSLAETNVPGVIVGIWQGGQNPYVRAFGVKDVATGEPMTTDLHMRIGSNTKAFVTTGILQLVDQGKLSLDDPISKFVAGVPNGDNITIRNLAGMRSGLVSYSDDVVIPQWLQDTSTQFSTQDLLNASFNQANPILFQPGERYDYSNTNTVLLGVVLEQLSGQSLRDYIRDQIVVPVGLTHTEYPTLNGGGPIPTPLSHGYGLVQGARTDLTFANFSWGNAAGCMVSTVEDLGVWVRVLGRGSLLTPATQAERLKFEDALPEHDGYGLGIENNNGWLGHGGNIFSHVSYPHYLPSEDLTMVLLFNSGENIYDSVKVVQAVTRIISPNNVWPDLPLPPQDEDIEDI
jgi:D-alanyl-D-alanine carboxypeptidase